MGSIPVRSCVRFGPVLAAFALVLSSCSSETSMLDPGGPAARRIADLSWFMFVVSGAITLLVFGLLLYGLLRRRKPGAQQGRPRFGESALIIAGGVAMPLVVLLVLSALGLAALATDHDDAAVRVEAIGHQFWWEFRLPEEGVVTANELAIPVGRPVELTLRSADVIHSFWVPRLAGKIDMVPGRTNELVLQADEAGVYRGQCAEFCGIQHAQMALYVEAVSPEAFDAWVRQEAQPAMEPSEPLAVRGRQVFLEQPCASCHTIRGTPASGGIGPDLTHFASRRTIGAGAVENTRGNLGGWMVDSQSIKPGNRMPPVVLDPEEVHALISYMETLE